jgi:spore coat protein H
MVGATYRHLGALIGLLLACSHATSASDGKKAVADESAPSPAPDRATSDDPSWVFDEAHVRTYELELSAAEWTALQEHALDEQYKPATLRVDGTVVGEVGLRFKGSSGTLGRCARRGRLLCPKLSMKLKFDEYEPTRRFHGLKRLNFHSMLSDASHLHERLSYRLFREMGVVAPRAGHARLSVNGESWGLFSLVEDIDGRFTHHHFDGGDGNLYKEQWPNTDDVGRLNRRLQTNEEAPDHTAMIQFRNDLAAATPEGLAAVVERYMDVDNLLAYIAVDHTIMNWDGMTAFYCKRGCWNHNYYFYQHEGKARFSLIPWDLDNTFRLYNSFDRVPSPRVIPADCSLRYPATGGLTAMAPACDPLLQGAARADASRYRAQLTRLLEGPFEAPKIAAWIDARVAQLTPLVAEDTRGPGLREFRTHVEALRRDLRLLELRLRAERDDQPSERWRLDVDAVNDFETATSVGVKLGIPALSAPDSRFEVELARGRALGGEAELNLDFEFRDAAEPGAHWLRFTLPFGKARGADLNLKSALRVTLQSDSPRTIRIGILSSNYSQVPTATSAALGWDVPLDGTRQTVELLLSQAAFPAWSPPLPDVPSAVFAYGAALLIDPLVQGKGADGYLGPGVIDRGRIRIDDIQLVP